MGAFQIAMLVLTGVPKLVEAFETLFSTKKKSGPKKKKLLLSTTKAGLTIAKVNEADQTLILDAVSALTDLTVKELNEAEPKDEAKP
jgi:hypothetical protein